MVWYSFHFMFGTLSAPTVIKENPCIEANIASWILKFLFWPLNYAKRQHRVFWGAFFIFFYFFSFYIPTESVLSTDSIESRTWRLRLDLRPICTRKSYSGIKYIDDMERECLWTICKMYNHIEQHEPPAPKKVQQEHDESEIKVWDDYNNKTSVFDLISGEFTIVRKLSNKTVIKRLGATSPHSGYVFNDSHCMYLFSTGTKYPNETLLTPYHIYTIQKHFGNFSASAKDLYAQGFGSRVKPKRIKENHIPVVKNEIITTDFPIDVYPTFIQRYILEISETLNANIDFLGGAILWASSLCVGNAVKIEVKKGGLKAACFGLPSWEKPASGKRTRLKQ